MSAPAVSLIVTAYNHERFVDECLESVSRQTFRDFEIVVLDDCSTDGSASRIEAWLPRAPAPVTFLRNERNLGICPSRNRSVSHCRGEFISALAADDSYEPDKIERQYAFFRTLGPEVAAVFSNMRVIDEAGNPTHRWFNSGRPRAEGKIFRQMLPGNFIPAPTVMIRRSALLEVGPYDESLTVEDFDMWLRLADRYEFRYLPGALVNYRILATSLSRSPRYAVDRLESRVHALLKWHGKAGDGDLATTMAWKYARRAFALDRDRGRALLAEVAAIRPRGSRPLIVEATRLPGAQRGARAAFGIADSVSRMSSNFGAEPWRR